jgi:G3E family GTPase
MTDSLPVNVITGFLGSGKTTLLRRLLASPELADTAVLVNEFGEVGLDHLLVETVAEGIVLLQSGCICCTIRGDLSKAILDLYSRRERGLVPPFKRLAVETTGLADPTPILGTILHDPVLRHHFHLGNVVTTVDALVGLATLEAHPESMKQAAIADRLVVTKADLATAAAVTALQDALRRLNPGAVVLGAIEGDVDARLVLGEDVRDAAARTSELRRWIADQPSGAHGHEHPLDRSRHAADIRSFCLTLEAPIEWAAFGIWLTLLLHRHGGDILRVKGIVRVTGSDAPVVVQGVQHVVHPPMHLPAWPFEDHRSRLVFIVRGIDEAALRASFEAFQALGCRRAPVPAADRFQ